MGLLPSEKTQPQTDPTKLSMLLYARSKFGKSEFCSKIPGAIFLATEPGLSHLETYNVPIPDWETFLAACGELAGGNHPFKVVIVDTIDICYKLCSQHVCAKHHVETESDLAYGRGHALVSNEFQRVLLKLASQKFGLVLISHSTEKEIEGRTGKYLKVVPTLPEKAAKFLLGLVDLICFGDFEIVTGPDGQKHFRRVLRTKPTIYYDAGDRSGRLPEMIDLDFATFYEAYKQALGSKKPSASRDSEQQSTAAASIPSNSTTATQSKERTENKK